jgi:hypothetical protein
MAKKNRKGSLVKILTAGIAVLACLLFMACSDDEEGDKTDYSHLLLTQHTWEVMIFSYIDPDTGEIYNLYVILNFHPDGRGVLRAFKNAEPNEHPLSPLEFRFWATSQHVSSVVGESRYTIDEDAEPYTLTMVDSEWLSAELGFAIPRLTARR